MKKDTKKKEYNIDKFKDYRCKGQYKFIGDNGVLKITEEIEEENKD